ncbi:hypothetical protein P691DRAFT_667989 [Macrolepiota fuliginosa MF-IS2]|uniref:Uncharacterized protein n=1 Tax=Macrolepiota fuliginosa MF-IS2 TaxID=1400762 RepID=A0A9P6C4V8_9AGAR|nr:hypothetical protein P691DRAFT_667989 [Macrolepiota fuliginosa MF-IS2]
MSPHPSAPPSYRSTPTERGYKRSFRVPPSYHTVPNQQGRGEEEPLLREGGWPPPKQYGGPESSSKFLKPAFLVSIMIIGLLVGYNYASAAANRIYDPAERDKIRREWDREGSAHRQAINKLLHERNEMKQEWDVEHSKLLELRGEMKQEQQFWENQRHQWNKERSRWEQEREKWEGEKFERERKLVQWGDLQKDQACERYGTARYQAVLEYTPPGWDQHTACKVAPIEIHQREVLANECHYNGNQMVGVWNIGFDEPSCKPWWRDTKDHGCTSRGSGLHRYEAHLEGYLERNEFKAGWAEMCNTTPHTMFGHTFNSPTECAYWPKIGVYGFWDVPDWWCT